MNPLDGIEIATVSPPGLLAELVALQQDAFPPRMQFGNPQQYYQEGFADGANVNVVLRAPDGAVTGYLLAIPQDRVRAELVSWDPAMPGDPGNLYIDLIQTLPGRRQITGLKTLLGGLCTEARQRGIGRISAHVRTATGLSRVVQKVVMDCRCLRRIDNWYDSGESFDFLDASTCLKTRGD
jgi:hypothetical protein